MWVGIAAVNTKHDGPGLGYRTTVQQIEGGWSSYIWTGGVPRTKVVSEFLTDQGSEGVICRRVYVQRYASHFAPGSPLSNPTKRSFE